jgi:hypothetical protein
VDVVVIVVGCVVVVCVVVEDGAGDAVVTGSDVVTSVAGVVDVMSVEGAVSLVDTIASPPLQPSVIESANDTAARPDRTYTRLTSRASIISGADRLRQRPRTHLARAVGESGLGSHVGSSRSSSMLLDPYPPDHRYRATAIRCEQVGRDRSALVRSRTDRGR